MAAIASSQTLLSLRTSFLSSTDNRKSCRFPQVNRGCARVSMSASLPVVTFEGERTGEVELDLKVARPETAKAVVHRAVITQLQNRRRGTASTLTRAEVRGGGKKPIKQKGSGGARQGSTRTPLRPGGGVVFGPKPCDWTIKINRKENRLAISTALQSAAVNTTVIDDLDEKVTLPKTKDFVAALARWGVDHKKDHALLITREVSKAVDLSTRNIKTLKVMTPRTVNIYDILRADKLLMTKSGLEFLTERYQADAFEAEDDDEEEGEEVGEVIDVAVDATAGGEEALEGETVEAVE
eukprot:TRINITY_DN38896_c0_g1_i1.p1 TRINITY_DN38896_c0_g1~~TRINITY_DN38896_c0_g1_i1.p1  ORF type:complete len:296 (+),score=42.87 TRINITY_DN38896_c0_g1_i1:66-953(+)